MSIYTSELHRAKQHQKSLSFIELVQYIRKGVGNTTGHLNSLVSLTHKYLERKCVITAKVLIS